MEKRWTDAQLSAIGAKNKKILVSAAAGSGKTATLIERIIRSVTEDVPPLDLSRMLIVTFTKAAASELKLRILSALNNAVASDPQSKHLKRQLLLLESAQICTIDSFCMNVLRDEFQNSDNDADFKIGDENELKFIKVKAMDASVEEVLKELHSEGKKDSVLEFFSVLTGPRRDDELAEKLLSVRSMLKTSPGETEYIKSAALDLESDAAAGEINDRAKAIILRETDHLFTHIKSMLDGYIVTFEDQPETLAKYGDAIMSDLALCESVISRVAENSYFEVRSILRSFSFKKLGILKSTLKTPQSESFMADRSAYKKAINKLISNYYSVNHDDIKLINEKSSAFLSILYRILTKYDESYAKAKRSAHLLEFDDLKSGVYKLFVDENGDPTQLALEYSSKYDIIYIDEYQDVDPIQDRIFNALSVNSHLFMVGDIKQSIYGFRGSDPSIFGDLRRSFKNYDEDGKEAENTAIYMSNNFRCSLPVINASNFICSHLFRETNSSAESVGYTKHDDLIFSKLSDAATDKKCEFSVIAPSERDDSEDAGRLNAEIKYVAYKISDIIKNEKKEDGSPFSYTDFAVLCDKNAQVKEVSDSLKAIGFPCDDAPTTNFFSSPEILLIRSLLSAIDNPYADIHLAAVLLSPIFEFSDNELIEIRKSSDRQTLYEALRDFSERCGTLSEKCKRTISFLSYYRGHASGMQVSEFMTMLWNKADIGAIATFAADDKRSEKMRRENIDKLYNYALAYSNSSFKTLHTFLAFLNDIIEVNPKSDVLSAASTEKSDKIHVMTIHKSKGLEFPVCFIVGTGESLIGRPKDSETVFDREAGLCFDPAARQGLVRIRSPYKTAALSRIKEKQTLEKIRLLYVAMTRARERLIITATRRSSVERSLSKFSPAFSIRSPFVNSHGVYPILNAASYAEWILLCDPFANETSNIILNEMREEDVPEAFIESTDSTQSSGAFTLTSEEEEILQKRFDYSYFSAASLLPAKISVSELFPNVLDGDIYPSSQRAGELSFDSRPWFMLGSKNASATEKGTATHLFLQFADFSRWKRYGTDAEIKRLTEKGFILSEHAQIINKRMLSAFFTSDFFKRILSANKLLREQRFNIQFPASHFTEDSERKKLFSDEYLLVQGVIDLIFEESDGRLILADYKTDYVTPEEKNDTFLLRKKFNERYSKQLSYYAFAVYKLFGRYPDEVTVYSLSAEKEVSVDITKLI